MNGRFLFKSPTVYQVFTVGNVWEQLVECFVVLHETLESGGNNTATCLFIAAG